MKIATLESFTVVGIEARTSNALEMSFDGVIPDLWGRFMQENLLTQIPDRADDNILAVYTGYESDDTGLYTVIIGAKVNRSSDGQALAIPAGMVATSVPASRYAVFESPQGPLARVVFETWQQIWKDKSLDRAYQADFEIYGPSASNPRDGRIEICVGLKSA